MPICYVCKQNKLDTEFSFKNKKQGTLHTKCKSCVSKYAKHHYQNNKEKYKEAVYRNKLNGYDSYQVLKEYINSFKIGGCIKCGETFPGALDFHHKNPMEKENSVTKLTSKKAVQAEIEKCIILCANCHRKYHCDHIETVNFVNNYVKEKY